MWSPDGNRILLTRQASGGADIWIADVGDMAVLQ
jgi:Tol biopolymer transport system component